MISLSVFALFNFTCTYIYIVRILSGWCGYIGYILYRSKLRTIDFLMRVTQWASYLCLNVKMVLTSVTRLASFLLHEAPN